MGHVFYENFDLLLTPSGNKTYKASVYGALGGDAAIEFSLEDAPEDVRTIFARNFSVVENGPGANGGVLAAGVDRQAAGKYLFQTVFGGRLLALLQVTLERAVSRNSFLRLRLNLTHTPELVGLPWETLRSETNNLALAIQTSVVRYQNIGFPQDDLVLRDKPLRMLVVISNPDVPGAPGLDVEKEWQGIELALKPLKDRGLMQVDRLPRAVLKEVDDWLFNNPTHIFHYIGHGRFDTVTGKGQLVFERAADDNAAEKFDLVDGERLAMSLRNAPALRLAALNSCEGAAVSDTDSYAGVAQHLLQTGNVPIVIAMRKKVSDDVAIAFAETFYQWLLVNNLSVDAAMTRARLSMRDKEQKRNPNSEPEEWGTPVLFMRNHNGYLVNFQDGPIAVPAELPNDLNPVIGKHYQTVMNALTKGKLVPFLGLDVNLFGRQPIPNWQPGGRTLPSYEELVNYLVSVSNHPSAYIPALADVSQYALLLYSRDENRGIGTFYTDLSNIFSGGPPTSLHEFWAKLAAQNDKLTAASNNKDDVTRRFLIVSSTYDNLLEKAFKQTLDRFHVVSYIAHGDYQGKFRHIAYAKAGPGAEAMPQAPAIVEVGNTYGALYDNAPVILKMPGTVGDGAGLRFAITEDQYLDFFSRRELASILPSQLLTKLRNSNHLFLGYNVREWSLRALLYRIWEDQKAPLASWSVQDQMSQTML